MFRQQIETALLKGYGYSTIVESLPESANLSARNIEKHVALGHMPLEMHVRRQIIEDRAKEAGKSLADATDSLIDHVAFARLGIQQAYEDIVEGKQHVTVRDAIRLVSLLAKTEKEAGGGGVDNQMVTRAFMVVMNAIGEHADPEVADAIMDAITADPVMQALNAAAAGISPDERIIEEPSRGSGTYAED